MHKPERRETNDHLTIGNLTEWVWRAILAFIILTVMKHDREITTINASRYTIRDGIEVVEAQAEVNRRLAEALGELRASIARLEVQVNRNTSDISTTPMGDGR